MKTFGERVREGMLSAGLATPAQLAERCGVPRSTAEKWLAMREARLSAENLFKLSNCLNVRMRWLMTGKSVMGWQIGDLAEHAVSILDKLTPEKAREWIACGERLAKKG